MTKSTDVTKIMQKGSETFPAAALKEVKLGRGFTSIDAYHIVERLNIMFGDIGEQWGVVDVEYETHLAMHTTDRNDNPMMYVSCTGLFWWRNKDDKKCAFPAVGDAQVLKENVAEAKKKALTNLISKASSYLGVGLGVYQGKGHDDPYLDRAEMAENDKPPKRRTQAPPPPESTNSLAEVHVVESKSSEQCGKRVQTFKTAWLKKAVQTKGIFTDADMAAFNQAIHEREKA